MRRLARVVGIIAIVLGASLSLACASPIKTSHDRDPNVDVSSFKTYKWIAEGPLIGQKVGAATTAYISPIDDQRIRRAIDRELQARGYRLDQDATAGLVVSYTIGTEEKLRLHYTSSYPGVYGGYGYGRWYGGSQVSADQYTEGTLSIELWGMETKQAVWVGWGSKRLSRDRDDSEKAIDEAVTKILEPLPASSS